MQDKSGLEMLVESLEELGLVPDVSKVSKGALFPAHNRFASSTTVSVLLSDSIYFLARANVSSSFTGIYSSIELPEHAEYIVHKRDWTDFMFLPARKTLGNAFIDKNVSIISPHWTPSTELSVENVQLFLQINKAGKPYKLVLQNNYLLAMIDALSDKKIIGIETSDWLFKKEDLENLLKNGEELIRRIKTASR